MNRLLHFIETSGARFAAVLINTGILFITAHALGTAGRGTIAQVTVWSAILSAIAGLSLGQLLNNRLQSYREENWRSRLLPPLLILLICGITLAESALWLSVISGFTPIYNGDIQLLLLLTLFFPFQTWADFAPQYFAVLRRLRFANTALVSTQTAALLLIVGYLRMTPDRQPAIILMLQLCGPVAFAAATARVVLADARGGDRKHIWPEIKRYLHGVVRQHPNTIGALVLAQIHNVMLSSLMGVSALAIFQLASQLVNMLALFPQSAALVLYGDMAEQSPDDAWRVHRRFILPAMGAFGIACCIVGLLLPTAVRILAGRDFAQAAEIGCWLLPCVWIMALPQLMTPQWICRGLFTINSTLTILSALLNAGLDYVLIRHYGIYGAVLGAHAIAWGCVFTAQCTFIAILERRYHRDKRPSAGC
jgi:O-antigen/teichoic acid export membrane protein